MPTFLDPNLTELNDKEATLVGSSSNASHSRSNSTGKTPILSGFPWIHNRQGSQALNQQTLLFNTININNNARLEVGWPRLARLMAEELEFESFCRFRELNVKNLLYYQAEIAEMEDKLRQIELEDANSSEWEGSYAREAYRILKIKDVKDATQEQKDETHRRNRQGKLILDIRERLKEYSKMKEPQRLK